MMNKGYKALYRANKGRLTPPFHGGDRGSNPLGDATLQA